MNNVREIKIEDDELAEGNCVLITETSSPHMGPAGRVRTTQVVLAKYLQHNLEAQLASGARVVDFGCGTGVLGLLLDKLGAKVVLADLDCCRQLVDQNIHLNNSKAVFQAIPMHPDPVPIIPADIYLFAGLTLNSAEKVVDIMAKGRPRVQSVLSFKEEEGLLERVMQLLESLDAAVQLVRGKDYHPLFRDERVKIVVARLPAV